MNWTRLLRVIGFFNFWRNNMNFHIPRLSIMLDTETLDTKATALVTQIAFHAMDLETGEVTGRLELFPMLTRAEQPRATVSTDTFQWWAGQSADLFKYLIFPPTASSTAECRSEIRDFLQSQIDGMPHEEYALWAGPADFDFPILANMLGEPCWDRMRVRCFRTLRKVLDPRGALRSESIGIEHNAAADAENQNAYLRNIYRACKGL